MKKLSLNLHVAGFCISDKVWGNLAELTVYPQGFDIYLLGICSRQLFGITYFNGEGERFFEVQVLFHRVFYWSPRGGTTIGIW